MALGGHRPRRDTRRDPDGVPARMRRGRPGAAPGRGLTRTRSAVTRSWTRSSSVPPTHAGASARRSPWPSSAGAPRTCLPCCEVMRDWASTGDRLVQRAVVAALCEPALLDVPADAAAVVDILDGVTGTLVAAADRRTEPFRVLRQALGYGWSVAIVAAPEPGWMAFERWAARSDADIAWMVRENLGKHRLRRLDPARVELLAGRAGHDSRRPSPGGVAARRDDPAPTWPAARRRRARGWSAPGRRTAPAGGAEAGPRRGPACPAAGGSVPRPPARPIRRGTARPGMSGRSPGPGPGRSPGRARRTAPGMAAGARAGDATGSRTAPRASGSPIRSPRRGCAARPPPWPRRRGARPPRG